MTIASTTSKVSYNGAGSVGPYTIPYYFIANADLVVVKADSLGVETTLALTTDYTLTGAGNPSGGALTLVSALTSGQKLVIKRSPEQVQEVDYVENSAFPAETHEMALDRLTMMVQDLQEQTDRSVKVDLTSGTDPDDLLDELSADVISAAASAATATTQAGLATTAKVAAETAQGLAESAQSAAEAARDDLLNTTTGFDKPDALTVDTYVDGEIGFRVKRNGSGEVTFGSPDGMGTVAPVFEVSEAYSRPKVVANSLLLIEAGDTTDLMIGRVNGTPSSPTAMLDGESPGQLYFNQYDGTNFLSVGPLYGAAWETAMYDSMAATGAVGPFDFDVDLGAGEDDVAVFVITAGSKIRPMSALKTKTTDYTFTYNSGTKVVTLTWVAGHAPAAGNDVWVMRRFDAAGTNPFYGRMAYVSAAGLEAPTQTGRGSSLIFGVTKSGEVVARPRMWLDGDTGDLVIAGKAVYEVHPTLGSYPDLANLGGTSTGGLLAGAPSGVHPINTGGKGAATILSSGHAIESDIAIRKWNGVTDGFDIDYDHTGGALRLNSVASDVKTVVQSVTSTGITTQPKQPCFLATKSAATNDVTGDSTFYTVVFDTEVTDRGANYNNGTGVFTAPIAGMYRFSGAVTLLGLASGHTDGDLLVVASNRDMHCWYGHAYNHANAAGGFIMPFSCLVDMDAGDTARVNIRVNNSTKVVDVYGSGTFTHFSGELVC